LENTMRNITLALSLFVLAGCADHLGGSGAAWGPDGGEGDAQLMPLQQGHGHPLADVDGGAGMDDQDSGSSPEMLADGAVVDVADASSAGHGMQDASVVMGSDAAMPAPTNVCGGTATKLACEKGYYQCTLGKGCFTAIGAGAGCPAGCALVDSSATKWICGADGDSLDCPACKC
jgi:hypothetical protein